MSNKFIVETSARHVHLTAEAVETLFGKGHTLTNKKDLSQPGQFACEEKVTVKGPKGALPQKVDSLISVAVEGNIVNVTRSNDERDARSKHGLYRTLISNMVVGVTDMIVMKMHGNRSLSFFLLL